MSMGKRKRVVQTRISLPVYPSAYIHGYFYIYGWNFLALGQMTILPSEHSTSLSNEPIKDTRLCCISKEFKSYAGLGRRERNTLKEKEKLNFKRHSLEALGSLSMSQVTQCYFILMLSQRRHPPLSLQRDLILIF